MDRVLYVTGTLIEFQFSLQKDTRIIIFYLAWSTVSLLAQQTPTMYFIYKRTLSGFCFLSFVVYSRDWHLKRILLGPMTRQ